MSGKKKELGNIETNLNICLCWLMTADYFSLATMRSSSGDTRSSTKAKSATKKWSKNVFNVILMREREQRLILIQEKK